MSEQHYVKCKNGDNDAENRWFRHCTKEQIPFVVVRTRNKYAVVHWDCYSLPLECDDQFTNNEVIRDQLIGIFQRHSNPKSEYGIGSYSGNMDKLFPEDARIAAEEVFQTLAANVAVGNVL